MRGPLAYCPRSGASLDPDRDRVPSRHGLRNLRDPESEAEPLTQGSNFSTRLATCRYFKRAYERTHDELDATVYRQACEAIRRLTALDPTPHDDYVWIALKERLHRHDDLPVADLEWMDSFVDLSCPRCYGQMIVEEAGNGYPMRRCASHCEEQPRSIEYRDGEIVAAIVSAYNRAFRAADFAREIDHLETLNPEHPCNPPAKSHLQHKQTA